MPKLHCKRVVFYAKGDEAAFFRWVEKINCISRCEGVSDSIVLHVKTTRISDENLRELLALFHRYKICMIELQQFLSERNQCWFFENEKAFWHKKVFKKNKTGMRRDATSDENTK